METVNKVLEILLENNDIHIKNLIMDFLYDKCHLCNKHRKTLIYECTFCGYSYCKNCRDVYGGEVIYICYKCYYAWEHTCLCIKPPGW